MRTHTRGELRVRPYVHHVPGRLRLRSPHFKRDRLSMQRARELLAAMEGVESVATNATTGSIVVIYRPTCVRGAHLLDGLDRAGVIELSCIVTNQDYFQAGKSRGQKLASVALGVILQLLLERSTGGLFRIY